MESSKITFSYKNDFLKEAVNRRWKKALPCILPHLLGWLAILVFGIVCKLPFFIGIATGALGILIINTFTQYRSYLTSTVNTLNKLNLEISISDSGLTADSQAYYHWSDFKAIYRYSDSWHLILKCDVFLILPIAEITTELQTKIIDHAQTTGCKIH